METLPARKGGFSLSDLPNTCRDAVVVARALGVRYIWIDSLCIVQDSKEDWEREAAAMCDVYSNAIVTLAGLDSPDSDTGLFVSDPTRQTYYLPCVLENGELGNVYARKHYVKLLMGFLHADRAPPAGDDFGGVLQTRGWTLQELTLSPRILWFSAWELGWSCRTETACECDPIPTAQLMERSAGRLTTFAQKHEPVNWLTMWRDFVQVFTRRKLSHATDRLPALIGIATAMSERIHGEYYAGLWEENLETDLLWVTNWFMLTADEQVPQRLPVPVDYAPTWSWASVMGPIWFVSMIHKTGYRKVWNIRNIHYTASTTNRFGPGRGTMLLEAIVIPVCISEDAHFVCPVGDEYVYFSDLADSWFPDRIDPHDVEGLSELDLCFVFGGVLCKHMNTRQETFTKFAGLVLKKGQGGDYERVGLIETSFSTDVCDGSWSDWQGRGRREQIRIA
jgi:hypothetical protein